MSLIAPLKAIDELLRGSRTPTADPSLPDDSRLKIPLRRFLPAAFFLGSTYGLFVGLYALGSLSSGGALHLLACTIKLPLLFLLTLLVTFPSLYVFAALAGFRLGFAATLRLLVASITVSLTVGASLGPILGFFTLSTSSYPFIVLLNVALLGTAGLIGAAFLLRTLRTIAVSSFAEESLRTPPREEPVDEFAPRSPARPVSPTHLIFTTWIVIYALVGLQMAWILRPFIGTPGSEFTLLRPISSNVFESIMQCLNRLQ